MANWFRTIGSWLGFRGAVEETPLVECFTHDPGEPQLPAVQIGSEMAEAELQTPWGADADEAGAQPIAASEVLNHEPVDEESGAVDSPVGSYLASIATADAVSETPEVFSDAPAIMASADLCVPVIEREEAAPDANDVEEPLLDEATADWQPPVELKPEAERVMTVPEIYELIATEVNHRTDSAIGVYERLLGATREDLQITRRSNRIAWSIGAVLVAIAAVGGIWAASEIAATRMELTSLKTQLAGSAQVASERDQLRVELGKTRELASKAQLDGLKARLEDAMAVSAERERLRNEISAITKLRQDLEAEQRMVRTPATQPVSMEQPAAERPALASERQDVWKVLLNGKE